MSYKFLSNILRKNYLNCQRSSDHSVTQWLYSGLPMCLGPEIVYYTWLRAQLWSAHLLDARLLHSLNMKYSFPTYCPCPPAKEGNLLWKWGMIIYNPGTKLNWLPELKRKRKGIKLFQWGRDSRILDVCPVLYCLVPAKVKRESPTPVPTTDQLDGQLYILRWMPRKRINVNRLYSESTVSWVRVAEILEFSSIVLQVLG